MKRILVIDDEAQVRTMLQGILEDEGYEVQTATNGHMGLQSYLSSPVDLVIVDIVMPEMAGIEVINLLNKCVPRPQIIAISGGSRDTGATQNLHIAKQLGARHTMQKPVSYEVLIQTIEQTLNNQ